MSGSGVTFTNVTASTLANNSAMEANATGGDGGALFLDGGTTWLGNNTFVGNSAGARGGAVAYMHACFQIPDVPGTLSSVVVCAFVACMRHLAIRYVSSTVFPVFEHKIHERHTTE